MNRKNIFLIAVIVVTALIYQCQPPKGNDQNTDVEVEAVQELDSAQMASEKLYTEYCSSCHGEQMYAFVDRKWKHGKSTDSLRKSITYGYPDTEMLAWGEVFSSEQIDDMVDYILMGIENVDRYGFQEDKPESDTFNTELLTIKLDTVFSGLEVPWDMNWLPSGDMLVSERSGKLYRVDADGNQFEIKGVPAVRTKDQDGLFEIELHPDFTENNWIYLSYSNLKVDNKDSTTTTMVSRFRFENDQLSNKTKILEALPYSSKQYHFGGRMTFDKNSKLFVTVGDRAVRDVNPQDISKVAGKVHRLNDDGSIPEDNPFVDSLDAVKSIYSYGHRNPQGLTIHPETGELWEHEHGPRGGDEINLIESGLNYGWPVISYGINYDATTFTDKLEQDGMEQPIHYWVPSIAPSGMAWVSGNKYSAWNGNMLVGSLRFKYLNRCVIENNKVVKEEILFKNIGRLRTVKMGPDGYIYVAVEKPGYVFRLLPISLKNT
ncbi:MAG: PQQ-dependent sugar dehydrogenase [Cyclobacteriaceae bacterium]